MRFGAAMTGALAGLQCLVAFSAFAEADQTHPETVWPTTSWMVSTAEEQGLDSGSLARLVETVGGRKQDSLLVIRHGKIVAEAYYAPYAVMTGIMRDDEYYPIARLIDDIAGAVKSDKPLPLDAVAQSLLAASIRDAATERPSPLGETPGLAKAISGKLYRFGDNELHVKTFSLNLVDAPASWDITTNESDEPSERFTGLLGLEGVFQLSPQASYGINAVKGRWLNAHTVSIEPDSGARRNAALGGRVRGQDRRCQLRLDRRPENRAARRDGRLRMDQRVRPCNLQPWPAKSPTTRATPRERVAAVLAARRMPWWATRGTSLAPAAESDDGRPEAR